MVIVQFEPAVLQNGARCGIPRRSLSAFTSRPGPKASSSSDSIRDSQDGTAPRFEAEMRWSPGTTPLKPMAGREAFFVCFGSNPNSGLSRLIESPGFSRYCT
jgi:hypothetical protein